MNEIRNKLNYAEAVAGWFLELGDGHLGRGNIEAALKCNYIAGGIFARQNRDLASVRIESNLQSVARRLSAQGVLEQKAPVRTNGPARCLHVLSEALPAGGLTAMASRWMQNDASGRVHSVALLSQQIPVPASLQQAVESSGGRLHVADPSDSLVNRAVWLRKLAAEEAHCVILHVDVADVICGVAFGVPGGPPVMLVNHAAHIFWNGASTTDLVVNCRGSELETFWSATYRGVGFSRCATVPIPLLEPKAPAPGAASKLQLKREARKAIDVPADAIVILTVGSSFKYLPIDGLDFVAVWEGILKEVPEAILLAVGFQGDERWKSASSRTGSRIRTLGTLPHAQLLKIQDAADLYVEAFPFGTTTSLLESGLKGLPVGLSPVQCPPPYGTDGIALDSILQRPATVAEYRARMIQLCRSAEERAAVGDKVRDSIIRHHSGAGWRQHLETAMKLLPREHAPVPEIKPVPTPEAIHERWSLFVPQWTMGYETTLEVAVTRALAMGLRPRLTAAVKQACGANRALRSKRTVPVPVLAMLFDVVLPLLRIAWAGKAFRAAVFLCRGSLLSRMRKKIAQLIGFGGDPASPYEEYRLMRDGPEAARKGDPGSLAAPAKR